MEHGETIPVGAVIEGIYTAPAVHVATRLYGDRVLAIIGEAFPETEYQDQITWGEVACRIHAIAGKLQEIIPDQGIWGITVTGMIRAVQLDQKLACLEGVHHYGHDTDE